MAISYRKLFMLLAENEIDKVQFRKMTEISSATMTKINKNEYVSMEILDRICEKMKCDFNDIVEHKTINSRL